MRKILITSLISVMTLICSAQTSIWKITKNEKTLYLGGSVHILRDEDYPLPSEFDVAFTNSDKIIFETDIKKLEDPQITQKIMKQGMFQNGKTLQSVLSEKVYNQLREECMKLSIPLVSLNNFKPSMVVLMLTIAKMKKMGISEDGVDKYFYNKSEKLGKKNDFLESIQTQIDVLMGMGDENEDDYVEYSLKSFEDMEKELEALITTWKDGTSHIMKRQLKELKADYPQIYQDLLVTRNNNWMPQIENFLQDTPTEFVIVGALHLHGTNGLLKQLKDKGYKVKQFTL